MPSLTQSQIAELALWLCLREIQGVRTKTRTISTFF